MTRFDPLELFNDALELPEDERQKFLRHRCSDRPELQTEVEALLRAHERARMVIATQRVGSPPAEDAPLGQVAHYPLLELLGRGGQGAVYRARDERLDRDVALKVLSLPTLPGSGILARFRREAKALSQLDHPGICDIFEAGEDHGVPFIAMRFIEGDTLAQRLDAQQHEEPDSQSTMDLSGTASSERERLDGILTFFERAARALHHAHEAGFLHRDIKPGNIMVTPTGDPVLLDFGLVRSLEGDEPSLTRSGGLLGTPHYLSPEQISGEATVDRTTDVYSLGVTLYECLTLARPFEAPTREGLYQQILSSAVPDPRARNARIPQDVVVILETTLDRDPSRRYGTALEFAEELRRVREQEPIRARPASLGYRTKRWVARNPVVAAMALLVLLSLAGGLAIALTALRETSLALDHSRALELSRAALEAGRSDPLVGLQLAKEAVLRSDSPEILGVLHALLSECCEIRRFQMTGYVSAVCFTADERTLVAGSENSGIVRFWSLDDDTYTDVGFAPRSSCNQILRLADGRIAIVNRGAGKSTLALCQPNGREMWRQSIQPACYLAQDPRNGTLLTVDTEGRARVWSLEGEPLGDIGVSRGEALNFTEFSRDGEWLLILRRAGIVELLHRQGEQWEPWAELHHDEKLSLARSSPDATRIAVSTYHSYGPFERVPNPAVYLWDRPERGGILEPEAAKVYPLNSDEQEAPTGIEFNEDGELLFGTWNGLVRVAPDGEPTVVLKHPGAQFNRIRLLPDGDGAILMSVSGPVLIDNHGGVIRYLRGGLGNSPALGASTQHGQLLAMGTTAGTVHVWQLSGLSLSTDRVPRTMGKPAPTLRVRSEFLSVHDWGEGRFARHAQTGAPAGLTLSCESEFPWYQVWDVDVAADGAVLHGGEDGRGHVHRGDEVFELADIPSHATIIRCAFSPDGRRVLGVLEIPGERGLLGVWSRTGERLWAIRSRGQDASFSPDGSSIATAAWRGRAQVWSLDAVGTGSALEADREENPLWTVELPETRVNSACLDDSGQLLLGCSDGLARLYEQNGATGRLLHEFEHDGSVLDAEFSPNGRLLATASLDTYMRIWDRDRTLLQKIPIGETGLSVAFTEDGTRLWTLSGERRLRSWFVERDAILAETDRRLDSFPMASEVRERYRSLLDD